MPPVHTPLTQSEPIAQDWPAVHWAGQLPPQSTSVSSPFFTKSVQLAAWQTFRLHTPVVQSEGALQPLPGGQGAQPPPPQSMSVSVPFCTPSEQPAI